MPETIDVAILGGGPAGAATALRLARAGHRVLLVELSSYQRPRAGETFGGEIAPLLRDLGVWSDFTAMQSSNPFRGVESAWGSAELSSRPAVFHPFGEGWHVDRSVFDRMLAQRAERAGAQVVIGAGATAVSRAGGLWQVQGRAARLLVDASGRGAPATAPRLPERRWVQVDRQIALVAELAAPGPPEPVLLLEAVREGWWYSVPQRESALLMVLVTDADLLPARGHALADSFAERLAAAPHSSARAAGAQLSRPPWIGRADSGVLCPARGDGWRAVGDAAHASDPLGGDGVVRALRSAEQCAREIDAELRGEPAPHSALSAEERFRGHLALRDRYCLSEGRWPGALFWARRRPLDWNRAPVLLDPRTVLQAAAPLADDLAAPVEALLGSDGLRETLRFLHAPLPAHQVLAELQRLVPLEPKRLLIGLQLLHSLGGVR